MILSRGLWLMAVLASLPCGLASAQTEKEVRAAKLENFAGAALPKPFACPRPPGPGSVSLRIIINARGDVSKAKAFSGPEKLFSEAEACARTWKFENPPSAPVAKTVLLRYESRDCPGAESERGELQYSWGLRDRFNHPVAYVQGEEPPPPIYPDEERKAGIVGTMALSVPLNADGSIKEIRVLHGLSPSLDKAVMDELRPLKFRIAEGTSELQLADARFQISFHAACEVQSVSSEN